MNPYVSYYLVLINLVLGLLITKSGFSQNSELERVNNIVQGLSRDLEAKANETLSDMLYECNHLHLGKRFGGETYVRFKLLRNGRIKLQGKSPTINLIRLNSEIPVKTTNGRLSWEKDLGFDVWKEHKGFMANFTILTTTMISQSIDGQYIARSTGTYKWDKKPYINIDMKVGTVKIGLDEIAGSQIQKAINQYIQEMDKEFEDYLNN